jgi:hypothetical protein
MVIYSVIFLNDNLKFQKIIINIVNLMGKNVLVDSIVSNPSPNN